MPTKNLIWLVKMKALRLQAQFDSSLLTIPITLSRTHAKHSQAIWKEKN